MNKRTAGTAAALTLFLGIALVVAIGFAVDALHGAVAHTEATVQINNGAAEIARGPARVMPLAASDAAVPGSFLLAQAEFRVPGSSMRPVLPPSVSTAPGSAPSPSQQLEIQTYRNQLQLTQQPAAGLTPQGLRDQLDAGEQLNQLNQQARPGGSIP